MVFKQYLKSSTDFYVQIALVLVIVILINLIFSFLPLRFDITEAKVYSISDVTKETLNGLDDLVTIKVYFTKDLPGYLITVRERVKDILAEYKNYGGGNIRVLFLNPNENPKIEREARALGIPPIQFNVVKKDKFEVAQGYLGIAVLYGDKYQVIPVVQDISTLEYDLTAAIKKVISGKELTIGILKKDDAFIPESELEILTKVLRKQYRVKMIDISEDSDLIGDDIDTLIIPGVKDSLSKRELYIIDQFILSGRGVLIAVNGVEVGQGLLASTNDSNIFDLIKSYGVSVNKDLIFDPVWRGEASFSSGFIQFFTPYGFWPKITNKGFNKDNVLVNKLESVVLPWVSSIKIDNKGIVEVLARTSPKSSIVKENFDLSPQSIPDAEGKEDSYPVSVYINGKLKSYFKNPVKKEGDSDMKKEVGEARIIIISDADLLRDGFIQRYESDLVFLQNIIDGLTLDKSLAEIRSKSITERPIRNLDNTARALVKYVNIAGVPVLVILFAVFRFIWRRKSQKQSFI